MLYLLLRRLPCNVQIVVASFPKVASVMAPLIPSLKWIIAEKVSGMGDGESGSSRVSKVEKEREYLENLALAELAGSQEDWERLIVMKPTFHPAPGATLFGTENGDLADFELEFYCARKNALDRKGFRAKDLRKESPVLFSKKLLSDYFRGNGLGGHPLPWRLRILRYSKSKGYVVKLRHPFGLGWLSRHHKHAPTPHRGPEPSA